MTDGTGYRAAPPRAAGTSGPVPGTCYSGSSPGQIYQTSSTSLKAISKVGRTGGETHDISQPDYVIDLLGLAGQPHSHGWSARLDDLLFAELPTDSVLTGRPTTVRKRVASNY